MIDLHGYRVQEAYKVLEDYITDFKQNLTKIRKSEGQTKVVTGKGLHGKRTPALKNAIDKYLTKEGIEHEIIEGGGGFLCTIHA